MHNFAALLRFKLKNIYWNSMRLLVREKAGVLKLIGFIALMLIGFGPLLFLYSATLWQMAPLIKAYGDPKLLLTMSITVAQLMILFFSVHAVGS